MLNFQCVKDSRILRLHAPYWYAVEGSDTTMLHIYSTACQQKNKTINATMPEYYKYFSNLTNHRSQITHPKIVSPSTC
jgi:hypothetical protein